MLPLEGVIPDTIVGETFRGGSFGIFTPGFLFIFFGVPELVFLHSKHFGLFSLGYLSRMGLLLSYCLSLYAVDRARPVKVDDA